MGSLLRSYNEILVVGIVRSKRKNGGKEKSIARLFVAIRRNFESAAPSISEVSVDREYMPQLCRNFILGVIHCALISGASASAVLVVLDDPLAEPIRAAAEANLQRTVADVRATFERARQVQQFRNNVLLDDLSKRLFENLPFGSAETTRENVAQAVLKALIPSGPPESATILRVLPKDTALEQLRTGKEIKGLKFDPKEGSILSDLRFEKGEFVLPIAYVYDRKLELEQVKSDLNAYLKGISDALAEAIETNADFELFEFLRLIANRQISSAKSLSAAEQLVRTAVVDYTAFILTRTYVGVVAANRYLGTMLTRSDFKTAEIDILQRRINGVPATDQDLRLPIFLMLVEARNVVGPSVVKEIEEYVGKKPAGDAFLALTEYVKLQCRMPANEVVRTAIRRSVP